MSNTQRPRRKYGYGSITWNEAKQRFIGEPPPKLQKGSSVKVSGRTYEECETKLVRLCDELRAGKPTSNESFGVLAAGWLSHHDVTDDTRRHYQDLLNAHILPVFGHQEIGDIDIDVLQAFMDQRADYSRSTLSKIKTIFKFTYRRAHQRGYVRENLGTLIDIPVGAKRSERGKALSHDDARLLRKAAQDERLAAWFYVLLDTGARPGEISRLAIADLNLDELVIHLDGRKTKTPRSLRISEATADAIRAFIATSRIDRDLLVASGSPWPHPELVFTTSIGTPLTRHNTRRMFRRVVRNAGLDHLDWSPTTYTLRHTVATEMAHGKAAPRTIASKLGHSDPRTTEKYYVHPSKVVEDGVGLWDD